MYILYKRQHDFLNGTSMMGHKCTCDLQEDEPGQVSNISPWTTNIKAKIFLFEFKKNTLT